jgi:hypothetical protein
MELKRTERENILISIFISRSKNKYIDYYKQNEVLQCLIILNLFKGLVGEVDSISIFL